MAKKQIGVGSSSNDGTGDTLRQGAVKVNANFNEIYSIFGDNNNLVSYAKTAGIASDSQKLDGKDASYYTSLSNLSSGQLTNDRIADNLNKPSGIATFGSFVGNLTGDVTGDLTGAASTSQFAFSAYGLSNRPDIFVGLCSATTLSGPLTGNADTSTLAATANYAFKSGLSTDSQRAVYSQLAGVSTVSGYATTAGIATVAVNAQGLTGTPNVVVGVATATRFVGDGSLITNVVASSTGIIIRDDGVSVGVAASLDFGVGATVSPASAGIATVTVGVPGISTNTTSQFNQLEISGITTFTSDIEVTSDIKANGNITGDGNTIISGISSAFITDVHGALTGNADTATSAVTVTQAAQPTITSVGTLTSLTVSGNVSIGGTLTYEDVTNVDSVGLITARLGMVASGVVTATGFDGPLTGTATTASNANLIAVSDESSDTTCSVLYSGSSTGYVAAKTGSNLTFNSVSGTLESTNISVASTVTASTFSGGGTIPIGGIIMWNGSGTPPSGWALCDGNNGTPDLSSKFIIGATSHSGSTWYTDIEGSNKSTGGTKDGTLGAHSHTIENHTHSFSGSVSGTTGNDTHNHSVSGNTGNDTHNHTIQSATGLGGGSRVASQNSTGNTAITSNDTHNHSFSANTNNDTHSHSFSDSFSGNTGNPSNRATNSQGVTLTNKNLPPYFALAFIMRIS